MDICRRTIYGKGRTYLDERGRLRRRHSPKHGVEQFRKDGEYVLSRSSQQVNDQVAYHETARLILALELLRNHLEHTVQAGAMGNGVRPRLQLRVVFADDGGQGCGAVLQDASAATHY